MFRRKPAISRVIALAFGLASGLNLACAYAATNNDTLQVSIIVTNACSIVANDMSFGTVNTLAIDLDTSSTITVTCTGIGNYSVALDAGTGTGSTLAQRKLNFGANTINYNLYKDIGHTIKWGDGTGGTQVVSGTSTGGADALTVYGRVVGGQNPKPVGTYSSDIVATVTF